MHFGLVNVPFTFQRMKDVATEGLLFVGVYIEEIFTFSNSTEVHVSQTTEMFQSLSDRGLKI